MQQRSWATPERLETLERLNLLLTSAICAEGAVDCPVLQWFSDEMVRRLGPPDGSMSWLVRAAMATETVLAKMTQAAKRHLPFWLSRELVEYWKADDREADAYLRQIEQGRLDRPDVIYKRGPFDTISRREWHDTHPVYTVVGIGLDAFNHRRVAEVRLPHLNKTIWVDISNVALGISRNAFKRISRSGNTPQDMIQAITPKVREAVLRKLH